MQAIEEICEVNQEGKIIINVPKYFGNRVKVIILEPEGKDTPLDLAMLQENTGFVRQILSNPEEDIWNEL